MTKNVCYVDTETCNAELRYSMDPYDFVRLGQYAWNDGEVILTTSVDELREQIRKADVVVGHNIQFDLTAIFGKDSIEPLELAMAGRVMDSMVLASIVNPAPYMFTMRNGRKVFDGASPERAKTWLSLDNQCFQLKVPGKIGSLQDLAKKYNPPKTKVSELDYSLIPVDDPEFVEYAIQDVVALRDLARKLIDMNKNGFVVPWAYAHREQQFAAINAQMSRNGFRVDINLAQKRVEELAIKREELMTRLVEEYDFPTEGKSPWASSAGKEATEKILKSYGLDVHHKSWPKTPKGAPQLGGKILIEMTEGTDAEEMGAMLAELKGQRSLAQLALDSTFSDGRVHPEVTTFQRSGRSCLPETHHILTRRGILHVDDVRVGDETLDVRNRWVPVTKVLRYEDAPVLRYESDRVFLESTEEHRWVQWTETRGSRTVEPLDISKRRQIQLTPDSYPFDPQEMFMTSHMTDRERTAMLVGFLVTDGHAANRSDSHADSGRFIVYQTENKFYTKIRDFLGDWVTNDYSRPVRNHPDNIIHEMGLDTKLVKGLLESEGLDWRGGLRNSPSLMPWVLTLSQTETLAFLTAMYVSDGTVGHAPTISNLNPNKVDPIQLAAYRCGRRSNYRLYENPQNYQTRGRVALNRDRVSVRALPDPVVYNAPVWCVETESGTFTAWIPEGPRRGPYLTGNSIQKPGLTVWSAKGAGAVEKSYFIPAEGCKLLEMDMSNADARIVAAYSGDASFAERFKPGEDGHEINGRLVFGADYDSDPVTYRNAAKAMGHGWSYRGGAKALAKASKKLLESLGLDPIATCQTFITEMNSEFWRVVRWQDRVTKEGESGWVVNDWGRRMMVDQGRSYTQSPALYGQSGTRELMVDGLIRIAQERIEVLRWLVATVHDAIVWEVPESELDWAPDWIMSKMETTFKPKHPVSQEIAFPMGRGEPSDSWQHAHPE